MRSHSLLMPIFALLLGCGAPDTGGAPVSMHMRLVSAPAAEGPSELMLDTGWRVHLDRAEVVLGPIYLRAPRRGTASLWRLFVPVARAHPEHAQTLTEGQVLGEFLRPARFDALSSEPLDLGLVTMQAGRLDRLSVVLAGPGKSADAHGHTAYVRGWAERDDQRIDFDCSLSIEGDADETPEDIEARRRVDQIMIEDQPAVRDGDALLLEVHPHRWLERVDFSALVGGEDPCSGGQSTFALQWYLGIRRPEAFSATLVSEE